MNGYIRVFKTVDTIKTTIRDNIGTVNYSTGTITLTAFAPSAITNNVVNIFIEPNVYDLVPVREQIFQINDTDVTITVNDVNSIERRGVSSSNTNTTYTTSSY